MTAASPPSVVDVCICTFRRPSVRDTLARLARQEGAPPFSIIVADNDDQPSARAVVEQASADFGLPIRYVHAPAANISIARNACLDAATAPLIAFLDDDEIAPPGWLGTLFRALDDGKLDVVFGPVQAQYPPGAPAWAIEGDFHTVRPAFRRGGEIDTGYSGNVLFRRDAVGDLRFDPRLGRTGGEDSVFFARMHAMGRRLGYCPEAVVDEPTPADRLSFGWLMRRSFRYGQTFGTLQLDRGASRATLMALAALKFAYCLGATALTLWSPVRLRRNMLRGALHAGVVAKAFGANELELYRAPVSG